MGAAVASASVIPLAVPASVAVRAPPHDSAIIQSHRLGGNFAYRTDEAHAYAVQTPVIGQRTVPVGVSYYQGQPIVKSTTDYITHKVPQVAYYPQQVATYGAIPHPQLAAYSGLPHLASYPGYPFHYAGLVAAQKPTVEETVVEQA